MSVIQRIRDKGAWIVFAIIALALIAFILQDGIGRGNNAFSNNSIMGKVNGEKITRVTFEEKLALQEQMYGAQGSNMREQLIGGVWNQEVERIVLEQEYKKLGLQVSGKELTDVLFGPNSPLRQEFTDQATGEFKVADARQAIANIKKSKNTEQQKMLNTVYFEPTIQQTLRQKYTSLIQQAGYVPKWMIEKETADNNSISNISFVYVPYMSISDSGYVVKDEDIRDYMQKHKNEFKKEEETRSISYVTFDASPSSSDSLNTQNQLLSLKEEFSKTNDMEAFLNRAGTDAPYYNSYFSKSRMQQTNKDSLTKIPVGSVYGPYLDGNNIVLARMMGTKQWPDSVKVRHILIGTTDPRSGQIIRMDTTAKKLADSIASAVKGGADFNTLCLKYSDDAGSKNKMGVYEYFPQGQMVIPFNDFAFDNPVGMKGVVKTDFGYHYIEIMGQKNVGPAYKIAYLSKPIIASNETIGAANTSASAFSGEAKKGEKFEDLAQKKNHQSLIGSNIKQNDFSVMGIGSSRELVRWIYENDPGDVSEPIEVGDKYIVVKITGVQKKGSLDIGEARTSIEGIVRNEMKAAKLIKEKLKGATLEAIAASVGTTVQKVDSIRFATPFIPGIGSEPKIVGASFNKNYTAKASEPIIGSTGVFIVKLENTGATATMTEIEVIRQRILQGSRAAAYRSVEALKKTASIKDNRFKFY